MGKERIFAFGEKTPGRKGIKPDEWICFYANGNGVVAHARVASTPEKKPNKVIRDATRFPWVFRLDEPALYLNTPVVIDTDLRSKLEGFEGRDPKKSLAWYVQGTGKVTEHDF